MYNLLIVDDEQYAIDGIKASLKWEDYDIKSIYTARNNRQAKKIFDDHRIDILLCDIEMPQGSGLELLEWVRGNYPETKCIFLTCHDDFKFAQKAIQLGSIDYILKPVPEDKLATSINKVIDIIKEEEREKEYSRYGETWLKHKEVFVERFWLDIIKGKILSAQNDIIREAKYRGIEYLLEYKYLPVLTVVQRWNRNMSLHDEKTMEYALKKVVQEVIFEGKEGAFNVQLPEGLLSMLVFNDKADKKEELRKSCQKYTEVCNRHLNCDLSCYIGPVTDIFKTKE